MIVRCHVLCELLFRRVNRRWRSVRIFLSIITQHINIHRPWLVENRAKTYCRGRFFGNIDTTIPANQVNPSEGVRTTKARSNFLALMIFFAFSTAFVPYNRRNTYMLIPKLIATTVATGKINIHKASSLNQQWCLVPYPFPFV